MCVCGLVLCVSVCLWCVYVCVHACMSACVCACIRVCVCVCVRALMSGSRKSVQDKIAPYKSYILLLLL